MLDYAVSKARSLPVERGQQRIYAVIVDKKGKLVAEAANSYVKTHPQQKSYSLMAGCSEHKAFLHAEMRAMILARGEGHTMFVARVGYKGDVLPGVPCEVCQLAIRDSTLKHIVSSIN